MWVPGHRYGWGWLSVWVPGHYELRVKWVKKTTGFWLTTWHYKKGYWKKIAYKVQVSTPTKTTKVVVNAASTTSNDGYQLNDKKVVGLTTGLIGLAGGYALAMTGAGIIVESGGIGTPVGVVVFSMGVGSMTYSAHSMIELDDDPWFIQRN